MTDYDRFVEACNYPGIVDAAAVEQSLSVYLQALDVKRSIKRIGHPWWQDLGLLTAVCQTARDARDARDATTTEAAAHGEQRDN